MAGIGGLKNGAQRNVKPDQLRLVPRHNVNKENESNEDTEPGHSANILLCTVPQSTVTEQHGCQSFGYVLESRGFGIGAAVRSTNLCSRLSRIKCPNSFGRLWQCHYWEFLSNTRPKTLVTRSLHPPNAFFLIEHYDLLVSKNNFRFHLQDEEVVCESSSDFLYRIF